MQEKVVEMKKSDVYSTAPTLRMVNKLHQLVREDLGIFDVIGESVEDAVPVLARPVATTLKAEEVLVEQSLYALLAPRSGGYPTLNDYYEVLWILAANLDVLQAGEVITPLERISFEHWAPAFVTGAWPDVSYVTKARGFTLEVRLVGGVAVTQRFTKFLPGGSYKVMRVRSFGLPKYKHPVEWPTEYFNMQLWVFVDPDLPFKVFHFAASSPAFGARNTKLYNTRHTDCPYGLGKKCHFCYVGADRCARATHPTTYTLGTCKRCDQEGAYFDPKNRDESVCVSCCSDLYIQERTGALEKKEKQHDERSTQG